jgi:hypothetical protein
MIQGFQDLLELVLKNPEVEDDSFPTQTVRDNGGFNLPVVAMKGFTSTLKATQPMSP